MAHAVSFNSKSGAPILAQDRPCLDALFERIQAVWNTVCAWISGLASRLLSSYITCSQPTRNLAKECFNAFRQMTQFLEPVEVVQCEAVCKAWKDERLWKTQGENYNMKAPTSGKFKDRFKEIHEIAFGRKAWKEHMKADLGITPHLPPQVYKVAHKLKETHTLTLIPKTVNDQPLSFNTFMPLSEKAGVKLNIANYISKQYRSEAQDKALWVWMEKEVKPGSRCKTQAQAEKDYPAALGRALWITVSTVAHYARHKIRLFPQQPQWTYTRTCDGGVDKDGAWYVTVGGFINGYLDVFICYSYNDGECYGVAGVVSAEVLAARS